MTSAATTAVTTCSFGIRDTAFRPVILEVLGPATANFDLSHCLCFQNEFEHFSPEELRLADYETGLVFAAAPTSVPTLKRRPLATAPSTMADVGSVHHERSHMSSTDYSLIRARQNDDTFAQSREDGLQLISSETDKTPQIRFPPLSGLDEYTIRRLYSHIVSNVVRTHPKLVDWIGASAIAMIESLATKESSLSEEVEMQVAALKIEVMKAKLDAARAK